MPECQCTHPSHKPAVVIGGRYIVGENPTYRWGTRTYPAQVEPGSAVTVTAGPDEDGDFEIDQNRESVDPRHLTPLQEPAAPTVDDDLLRELADSVHLTPEYLAERMQHQPWQRLRTAWERTARLDRDYAASRLQVKDEQLAKVERERDEARAEVRDWQQQASELREDAARALEDVERLRAAQQLPDSPTGIRLRLDPAVDVDRLDLSPAAKTVAKAAQRYGFIVTDSAPADTSSDDEVDPEVERLARVMHDADSASLGSWVDVDREAYRDMARAAITHHATRKA